MEKIYDIGKKMIGAKVDEDYADKFSNFCKEHDFKQRAVFYNLTRWWLAQDSAIQEHIYRGRFEEAHRQIAADLADSDSARKIASRTKSRVSKLTQKQEKKSSKAV